MSTANGPEVTDSLALAMIASSNSPLLLLDADLNIVAASASFGRAFQLNPTIMRGCGLAALGNGEWAAPQLGSLLTACISERADQIGDYEMDLKRPGRETRRLVLNAQKLVYGDKDNVRLLLAIADVTEVRFNARFTEGVVREKNLLLEELQHRVANSLQIIASVLMQSARRVVSDETRTHLYDAHHRVMSVASLQQHLAATRVGDVEVRAYLTGLCKSIAASMIHDREQLTLEVHAGECVTSADASMSLGLIVTELVINAIKHAFPGHRRGKIIVDYRAHGLAWVLSVADDGVGIPVDPKDAAAGLGTSIVEALAKQLEARISVLDAEPGTLVLISSTPHAGPDGQSRALKHLAI